MGTFSNLVEILQNYSDIIMYTVTFKEDTCLGLSNDLKGARRDKKQKKSHGENKRRPIWRTIIQGVPEETLAALWRGSYLLITSAYMAR